MADDHAVFEQGHEAVLAALAHDPGALNVDVLAQACARATRASTNLEDATGWAEAAVACYEVASQARQIGFDRQGSEIILFGIIAAMVLKWGADSDSRVRDPARVERWLRELIDQVANPEEFERALIRSASSTAEQDENAVQLRERLAHIGLPLLKAGLLPGSMRPWFVAAGLVQP